MTVTLNWTRNIRGVLFLKPVRLLDDQLMKDLSLRMSM